MTNDDLRLEASISKCIAANLQNARQVGRLGKSGNGIRIDFVYFGRRNFRAEFDLTTPRSVWGRMGKHERARGNSGLEAHGITSANRVWREHEQTIGKGRKT